MSTQYIAGIVVSSLVLSAAAAEPPEKTAPAEKDLTQLDLAALMQMEVTLVTAQKREERMQDVPIAVTALNAEALEASGIKNTFDLKASVPGLDFTTAVGGFGLPRIRGVGSTGTGPGIENPVATYIDGVYISSSTGALTSLNDVEQVAVLKGPQGTLFGRNATGGLIQITTKKPSHDFAGDVQATVGNYATYGSSAYVTGGLTDRIAANAAFMYEERNDGFGRNLYTGNDVQTRTSHAARTKLLWEPGTATAVTLSADFVAVDAADPAYRNIIPNILGLASPGGIRDINQDVDPTLKSRQSGASLTVKQDFHTVQLMSISAYRHMKLKVRFDPDGTTETQPGTVPPFLRGFIIDNTQTDRQLTQEVQLLSTYEGRFKWMVGAFYLSAKGEFDPAVSLNRAQRLANTHTELTATQDLKSFAAFAQGTYAVGPATHLTAGIRQTRDERDVTGQRVAVNDSTGTRTLFASTLPNPFGDSDVFPRTTWRLSLDHRFSPEVMTYASYNRGFRSAAFLPQNIGLTDANARANIALKPEIVDAYEIGLKTDLFDRRVRFNGAAYYYEQQNAQIMQIDSGIQKIYNAEGAKIYGLDTELTALLTHRFTLNGGVGITHARYENFKNAVITTPLPAGGTALTIGDASGNRLQNTPDWTLNLGAAYNLPTSIGHFDFAANYYYNDGFYTTSDNRVRQDNYTLLDASVTWRPSNDRLSVRGWSRNLTDATYTQQLSATNFGDNQVTADPRTYGITVRVQF